MKVRFAALLIGMAATGLVAGCSSSDSDPAPSEPILARDTVASIATTLEGENFSTLRQLVQSTNALAGLGENQRITVMAPTNDAFNALFTELELNDETQALLLANDEAQLTDEERALRETLLASVRDVLLYHVIAGEYVTVERADGPALLEGTFPTLLQDTTLTVNREGNTVTVSDALDDRAPANVVTPNVWVQDGVIHVIDRVLLPAAPVETPNS
jgi:transforming growth factor-beta-induced protein